MKCQKSKQVPEQLLDFLDQDDYLKIRKRVRNFQIIYLVVDFLSILSSSSILIFKVVVYVYNYCEPVTGLWFVVILTPDIILRIPTAVYKKMMDKNSKFSIYYLFITVGATIVIIVTFLAAGALGTIFVESFGIVTEEYTWMVIIMLFGLFYLIYPTLTNNSRTFLEKGPIRSGLRSTATFLKLPLKSMKIEKYHEVFRHGSYMAGCLKSQIVVYESLLECILKLHLSNEEVMAFLTHDLAHWKYKHYTKIFLFKIIYVLILCAVFPILYQLEILELIICQGAGFEETYEIAAIGLTIRYLIWPFYNLFLISIGKSFWRKFERQADDLVVEMGYGVHLNSILMKMYGKYFDFPCDDALYSTWYNPNLRFLDRLSNIQKKREDLGEVIRSKVSQKKANKSAMRKAEPSKGQPILGPSKQGQSIPGSSKQIQPSQGVSPKSTNAKIIQSSKAQTSAVQSSPVQSSKTRPKQAQPNQDQPISVKTNNAQPNKPQSPAK